MFFRKLTSLPSISTNFFGEIEVKSEFVLLSKFTFRLKKVLNWIERQRKQFDLINDSHDAKGPIDHRPERFLLVIVEPKVF